MVSTIKKNNNSKEAGLGGTILCFWFSLNTMTERSSEQRNKGSLWMIGGKQSRQGVEQMLRPETGAHLALRSSKEASVVDAWSEKEISTRDEL